MTAQGAGIVAGVVSGTIAAAARLISGVQVRWVDSDPDPRQAVYFANHSSHLDFVVLWSSLPAKDTRSRPSGCGAGLLELRFAPRPRRECISRRIDRQECRENELDAEPADPRLAIEHMLDAMGENESLILFPEGTRGTGEEVAPFKSGLYYLCQRRPGLAPRSGLSEQSESYPSQRRSSCRYRSSVN